MEAEKIHGDRRADRRYVIELDVRYKLMRGRNTIEAGTGKTRDISSGGVAFSTAPGHLLTPGTSAELWIDWPMPLNGFPLRLVVWGRVARSESGAASIQTIRHEFRMAGRRSSAAGDRAPGAGRRLSLGTRS